MLLRVVDDGEVVPMEQLRCRPYRKRNLLGRTGVSDALSHFRTFGRLKRPKTSTRLAYLTRDMTFPMHYLFIHSFIRIY